MERRFPEQSSTRYYAAAASFLHGRFPAALGFARQTIEADPQRASAYNLLGAIHASLGQVEDARPAFQQALRLDRRDSATYTNLGVLELSLGNRSRAADLFAEALSLDPRSAFARQGLTQTQLVASRWLLLACFGVQPDRTETFKLSTSNDPSSSTKSVTLLASIWIRQRMRPRSVSTKTSDPGAGAHAAAAAAAYGISEETARATRVSASTASSLMNRSGFAESSVHMPGKNVDAEDPAV